MEWGRCLTALMAACLAAMASGRAGGEETTAYGGSDACGRCHDTIVLEHQKNPHGIAADPRSPAARRGCETCHGPGADHIAAGGKGFIISFNPRASRAPETVAAACTACHSKGSLVLWQGSSHEQRNLSCTTCHSIHQGTRHSLTRPDQTELCTPCHKHIRAQLLRQSRHPLREGTMKCSDCHNPHGTLEDHLVDSREVNLKCFECHAEKRGPFLWEHPPVIEACTTCHAPHGSSRDPLLNARMPYLCQRCHSNPTHTSNLYARPPDQARNSVYRVTNARTFYRACVNCHISVHGSNHPSGKHLLR